MIFSPDHPQFPNQPKGMKVVLQEHGLFLPGLHMDCKQHDTTNNCCARHILECQPDFMQQCSLVQETIEAAGHLCLFLPKYHCELNFIEFFWGAVKAHLCANCDYTFEGSKNNMEKALRSVSVDTIQKWEHRMYRWVAAYQEGLGAKDAQVKVQAYSSRRYKSHRQVPEGLASQFDT